jgi:signal transduction histidine kinase
VILTAAENNGETAVAAFQLGAADYILQTTGDLTDVVFSLSKCLRQAKLVRQNGELAGILVATNRSLERQVTARTEQLQALSKRLIRLQEDERASIARDLHDQLGQMLTGLKLQIEGASAVAVSPAKEKLEGTGALASEILATVREMTLQLRPRILDDFGLQPALEWHIELFQKRTGIAVESEFSLPPLRLPPDMETTIFRMVQEALNNIARHTCVLVANVTLMHDGEQVMAEITDRGPGFDVPVALARYDSLGLAGLKERVELAGGTLEVFSRLGQGTRLHASFPLAAPALASAP